MKKIELKWIWLILFILVTIIICIVSFNRKKQEKSYVKDYVESTLGKLYFEQTKLEWRENLYQQELEKLWIAYDIQGISEETKAKYRELYQRIYRNVRFSVGKVAKIKEGYVISLIVIPFDAFPQLKEKGKEYFLDFQNRNIQGDFSKLTEEEYQEFYANGFLQIMEKLYQEKLYLQAEQTQIWITKNEDSVWEIEENGLTTLHNMLIQIEY